MYFISVSTSVSFILFLNNQYTLLVGSTRGIHSQSIGSKNVAGVKSPLDSNQSIILFPRIFTLLWSNLLICTLSQSICSRQSPRLLHCRDRCSCQMLTKDISCQTRIGYLPHPLLRPQSHFSWPIFWQILSLSHQMDHRKRLEQPHIWFLSSNYENLHPDQLWNMLTHLHQQWCFEFEDLRCCYYRVKIVLKKKCCKPFSYQALV